jgi:excinuclease ABC subunit C
VPRAKDAIALAAGSSELYLLTHIRDEAHRFAITHHRKRRGKRSLVSVLDGIKGVGPSTKKALIQHFGTIKAIKAATVEELVAVDGVGPKLAATIHAALR